LGVTASRSGGAAAVVTRDVEETGFDAVRLVGKRGSSGDRLRHLAVLAGSGADAVAEMVAGLLRDGEAARVMCTVVVEGDADFVELVREKCGPVAWVRPVRWAARGLSLGSEVGDGWRVSREEVVGSLRLMLELRRLGLASGMEFQEALVEEMGEMRGGLERAGPLVMAVALAAWGVKKGAAGDMAGRERLF
jgi:hypothetical protein